MIACRVRDDGGLSHFEVGGDATGDALGALLVLSSSVAGLSGRPSGGWELDVIGM